jgi:hypothetical protein
MMVEHLLLLVQAVAVLVQQEETLQPVQELLVEMVVLD